MTRSQKEDAVMADGILNKMKRVIGLEDGLVDIDDTGDSYDDDFFDDEDSLRTDRRYGTDSSDDYHIQRDIRNNDFEQPRIDPNSKVISMQSVSSSAAAKTQPLKLLVTEPQSFNDCPKLVNSLRTRKPVIINVEHLEREVARKIFDFLSGATYAIDGKVQKISENIFVFAPANVEVLTSDEDQVENHSGQSASYSKEPQWNW